MVAGWRVFGKGEAIAEERDRNSPAVGGAVFTHTIGAVTPTQGAAASTAPRRTAIAGVPIAAPANDPHGPVTASTRRETVFQSAATSSPGTSPAKVSRARGIGSRFRAAPARAMEKFT
jgi:type IV secretion system protein VirB6